jgi:hypothetical protein
MPDLPLQTLTLSDDDTLWVARIPIADHERIGSILNDIALSGKLKYGLKGTIVQFPFEVDPESIGDFGSDHFLLQGIDGTGLITVILPRMGLLESVQKQLASFAQDFDPLHGLISTRAENPLEKVLVDMSGRFDEDDYMYRLQNRRIDITFLETEKIAYTHFVLWCEDDAERFMTRNEKISHKIAALDFIRARAGNPGFISGVVQANIRRILETRAEYRLSTYARSDKGIYRKRLQNPELETFVEFCDTCKPQPLHIFRLPEDLQQACEVQICEWVNPGPVWKCRLNTDKPYETP